MGFYNVDPYNNTVYITDSIDFYSPWIGAVDGCILLHILLNPSSRSAAFKGSVQWSMFSTLYAIRALILYSWADACFLRDNILGISVTMLLAPLMYGFLNFRSTEQLFGRIATALSVGALLHGDMLLHVIMDLIDVTAAFETATMRCETVDHTGVTSTSSYDLPNHLEMIVQLVGIFVALTIYFHGYSFAGEAEAGLVTHIRKTLKEQQTQIALHEAAQEASDVFLLAKSAVEHKNLNSFLLQQQEHNMNNFATQQQAQETVMKQSNPNNMIVRTNSDDLHNEDARNEPSSSHMNVNNKNIKNVNNKNKAEAGQSLTSSHRRVNSNSNNNNINTNHIQENPKSSTSAAPLPLSPSANVTSSALRAAELAWIASGNAGNPGGVYQNNAMYSDDPRHHHQQYTSSNPPLQQHVSNQHLLRHNSGIQKQRSFDEHNMKNTGINNVASSVNKTGSPNWIPTQHQQISDFTGAVEGALGSPDDELRLIAMAAAAVLANKQERLPELVNLQVKTAMGVGAGLGSDDAVASRRASAIVSIFFVDGPLFFFRLYLIIYNSINIGVETKADGTQLLLFDGEVSSSTIITRLLNKGLAGNVWTRSSSMSTLYALMTGIFILKNFTFLILQCYRLKQSKMAEVDAASTKAASENSRLMESALVQQASLFSVVEDNHQKQISQHFKDVQNIGGHHYITTNNNNLKQVHNDNPDLAPPPLAMTKGSSSNNNVNPVLNNSSSTNNNLNNTMNSNNNNSVLNLSLKGFILPPIQQQPKQTSAASASINNNPQLGTPSSIRATANFIPASNSLLDLNLPPPVSSLSAVHAHHALGGVFTGGEMTSLHHPSDSFVPQHNAVNNSNPHFHFSPNSVKLPHYSPSVLEMLAKDNELRRILSASSPQSLEIVATAIKSGLIQPQTPRLSWMDRLCAFLIPPKFSSGDALFAFHKSNNEVSLFDEKAMILAHSQPRIPLEALTCTSLLLPALPPPPSRRDLERIAGGPLIATSNQTQSRTDATATNSNDDIHTNNNKEQVKISSFPLPSRRNSHAGPPTQDPSIPAPKTVITPPLMPLFTILRAYRAAAEGLHDLPIKSFPLSIRIRRAWRAWLAIKRSGYLELFSHEIKFKTSIPIHLIWFCMVICWLSEGLLYWYNSEKDESEMFRSSTAIGVDSATGNIIYETAGWNNIRFGEQTLIILMGSQVFLMTICWWPLGSIIDILLVIWYNIFRMFSNWIFFITLRDYSEIGGASHSILMRFAMLIPFLKIAPLVYPTLWFVTGKKSVTTTFNDAMTLNLLDDEYISRNLTSRQQHQQRQSSTSTTSFLARQSKGGRVEKSGTGEKNSRVTSLRRSLHQTIFSPGSRAVSKAGLGQSHQHHQSTNNTLYSPNIVVMSPSSSTSHQNTNEQHEPQIKTLQAGTASSSKRVQIAAPRPISSGIIESQRMNKTETADHVGDADDLKIGMFNDKDGDNDGDYEDIQFDSDDDGNIDAFATSEAIQINGRQPSKTPKSKSKANLPKNVSSAQELNVSTHSWDTSNRQVNGKANKNQQQLNNTLLFSSPSLLSPSHNSTVNYKHSYDNTFLKSPDAASSSSDSKLRRRSSKEEKQINAPNRKRSSASSDFYSHQDELASERQANLMSKLKEEKRQNHMFAEVKAEISSATLIIFSACRRRMIPASAHILLIGKDVARGVRVSDFLMNQSFGYLMMIICMRFTCLAVNYNNWYLIVFIMHIIIAFTYHCDSQVSRLLAIRRVELQEVYAVSAANQLADLKRTFSVATRLQALYNLRAKEVSHGVRLSSEDSMRADAAVVAEVMTSCGGASWFYSGIKPELPGDLRKDLERSLGEGSNDALLDDELRHGRDVLTYELLGEKVKPKWESQCSNQILPPFV